MAVLARVFGAWWVNACRIIYVLDEQEPVRRVGFAYGTLPDHVEKGEERFSIEWSSDDRVWYDIRSFSQPNFWMTRLAYPLTRRLQHRFVVDSKRAMARIVRNSTP